VEKVKRNRVHPVLVDVVKRTKSISVAQAARFDNLRAELSIAQIDHCHLDGTSESFLPFSQLTKTKTILVDSITPQNEPGI
jgi:hypothetical protein